ncbi:MAG: response regulator transcription factor [Pedosphaera sp.]|nr:response regulator transcription factor [Pedosphaera sp.]
MRTRILLADDHALVRAGIRSLLEKLPAFEVVGEASTGHEALELAEKLRPNLVLLDITMSGLNGLEVVERLNKSHPTIKVLILSMHTNEEYAVRALRSGAAGYMIKDAAAMELELAIQAVMREGTYLSPAISRVLVDKLLTQTQPGATSAPVLTPRQREILQLLAEGKFAKEIAFQLHLSVKTVETHRAQLMERLNIHDVPGLVRYAIRTGLISEA